MLTTWHLQMKNTEVCNWNETAEHGTDCEKNLSKERNQSVWVKPDKKLSYHLRETTFKVHVYLLYSTCSKDTI